MLGKLTTLLPLLLLAAVATQGADGATQTRAAKAPVTAGYVRACGGCRPHDERERRGREREGRDCPANRAATRATCRVPPTRRNRRPCAATAHALVTVR